MRRRPSPILIAVHATATGLHRADVMDAGTQRAFDQLCLLPAARLPTERRKGRPRKLSR